MTARAVLLLAPGTNCHEETAWALRHLGAAVTEIPWVDFFSRPEAIHDARLLVLPGGFSFGDALGAGTLWGEGLRRHRRELQRFHGEGKIILGICNGFQVLLKAGLLPDPAAAAGTPRPLTLATNESGRFECRWVSLQGQPGPCPLFQPGRIYRLPVAHGEGNLQALDLSVIVALMESGQVPLTYVTPDGSVPAYPDNPNGSLSHAAAVCDPSGRIVGLMPHPERFSRAEQYPGWTRARPSTLDGLDILEEAIRHVQTHC